MKRIFYPKAAGKTYFPPFDGKRKPLCSYTTVSVNY